MANVSAVENVKDQIGYCAGVAAAWWATEGYERPQRDTRR